MKNLKKKENCKKKKNHNNVLKCDFAFYPLSECWKTYYNPISPYSSVKCLPNSSIAEEIFQII